MHNPPALTQAVGAAQNRAISVRSVSYRASHLSHFSTFAAAQPLFCAGGGAAGSRYVAPHGPAALYVALDADTACRELNQDFYRTARSPGGRSLVRSGQLRPVPCVLLGVLVRVSRVLNLTRANRHWRQTRLLLGISTRSDAELLQPWAGVPNAATQVLGATKSPDGRTFAVGLFQAVDGSSRASVAARLN